MAGGIITLTAARPPRTQVHLLVTDPPQVSGGVGGWETVDRAGRRPARWWRARPEQTMTITGALDSRRPIVEDNTVEERLTQLLSLGRVRGGTDEPSPVRVTGDARDPDSRAGALWVVQNISLGERLFTRTGTLRRQLVTVDLVDFDAIDAIRPLVVKRTRATAARQARRTITSRQGDTLRGLAVRELGTPAAWMRIRNANPKTLGGRTPVGPDEPIRAGVRLVIP